MDERDRSILEFLQEAEEQHRKAQERLANTLQLRGLTITEEGRKAQEYLEKLHRRQELESLGHWMIEKCLGRIK